MPNTTAEIKVANPAGGAAIPVSAIVDTHADHTVLPASLLTQLGIQPNEQAAFRRTDDTKSEYDIGTAIITIGDRERPCPAVFGIGDACLLGASTLAIFNLADDPATGSLIPETSLSLGHINPDGAWSDYPERLRPTMVAPRDGYRIWVRFSDGASGEVDLSHLAGEGIFRAWEDRRFFESVGFNEHGDIAWGDTIDLCPDTLYAQLSKHSH